MQCSASNLWPMLMWNVLYCTLSSYLRGAIFATKQLIYTPQLYNMNVYTVDPLYDIFMQPRHVHILCWVAVWCSILLTHWGREKMAAVSQTTFSNAFSWTKCMIKISLKFVTNGPINKISAFVQIMVWRRSGDKPLSEPMMVRLPRHICVSLCCKLNQAALTVKMDTHYS